jgi:hypothetical protein
MLQSQRNEMSNAMLEFKETLHRIESFMERIVEQNETVMSQLIDSKLGVIPREFMRVETHNQIMRTTNRGYVLIFMVALGVANIKEIAPFVTKLFVSATTIVDSAWGQI